LRLNCNIITDPDTGGISIFERIAAAKPPVIFGSHNLRLPEQTEGGLKIGCQVKGSDRLRLNQEFPMYLDHFGLNKMPFDISPDPRFLWLGEKHREALAHLKFGILGDKRFLLITGDVGTGKTALIKCLVKMIDVQAIVVTIPDPDMSRLDFYNFLANELNMGRQFNSKGEFLIHFKNFLLQAYRSHKKVLLIIDEAQRLNHDILHEIRFLANIDFDGQILINIFLVGQNEFKNMLMEDRNKSVRDRITASYQINPLTETEVFSYIRHRLRVAGTSHLIFTPDAMHTIYQHTRGYPRVMNILCDRALLNGFIKEEKVINPAIVEEAAADLKMTIGTYRSKEQKARQREKAVPSRFKRSRRRKPMTAPIAAAGLILLLGFGIFLSRDFLFENFQQLKNNRIATRITEWFQGTDQDKTLVHKQSMNASNDALKESTASSSADEAISKRQAASKYDEFKTPLFINKKIGVPGTAGTSFQKGGAAQPEIASTRKKTSFVVYFDHSSDEIPPHSLEVLNRISGIFFKSPVKDITLKGYTDSFGNENYEKYMSVERAMRVKKFFVSKGIPASSLNVYGMGSENPTGINTTAEERQKNRRVEIEVSLSQNPKQ
jgi:general secretion pathway protein A